eukprot:scaffold674_cov130-Amphora_coffeaeformis.AAC.13
MPWQMQVPKFLRRHLGYCDPSSRAVVAGNMLMVKYSSENTHRPSPHLGFGIYVFYIHDLEFLQYIPMFHKAVVIQAISEDWILYDVEGETPSDTYKLVPIQGGHVGRGGEIRFAHARTHILLVTRTSLLSGTPDPREGNMEIDHSDLITKEKLRTLDTKIPWMYPADDDTERELHRMLTGVHVMGSKLVV